MAIFQDLKTWRFWRHFLTRSFACLGVLSTALQTNNVINPTVTVFQGTLVLLLVIAISLIGGLIWSWPRPITQDYSAPKTKISIVKGDMLAETTHLVIGTNDTFDTETPIIIANGSLQGQALQRLYGGDLKELDSQLAKALAGKPTVGTIAKEGKQTQYGIGTIATVKHASRLIFFLAYCEMDAHNTAHSTPDKVWKSLQMLWDEVSKRAMVERCRYRPLAAGKRGFRASSQHKTPFVSRYSLSCLHRATPRFVMSFESLSGLRTIRSWIVLSCSPFCLH
ncbi:MAG: hypothetical protein IPH64_19405 [Comamonadaceae bacterium]|nr:hypothetical protein [Comamonadaceae bacterium]